MDRQAHAPVRRAGVRDTVGEVRESKTAGLFNWRMTVSFALVSTMRGTLAMQPGEVLGISGLCVVRAIRIDGTRV